jgi:hypothetical protein
MTNTRARRVWIVVAVIVGGIVLLNVLARGLDEAVGGNEPGGADGSSYATAPGGTAAYASLLHDFGHPVRHQLGPLADESLDPSQTLIVLEPTELTNDDTAALLQFATDGGVLVIGGRSPFYLRSLRDDPPQWTAAGSEQWTADDPQLGGAHTIDAQALGSWADPGSSEIVVDGPAGALLTQERVGTGTIRYLADTSTVSNEMLARADNAAFGLALAGPPRFPVTFAEGVHGYGQSRGFSAIPSRWKAALLTIGLAALAFVWSRARRFGPPDRRARELPPARAEYVRALSVTLERTHDEAGALAPLQRWTRERVAARGALRPDASDAEIADAARAIGASDHETAVLFAPITTDDDALALGRFLARVTNADRRST